MKLVRSLGRRIVFACMLCALIGVVGTLLVALNLPVRAEQVIGREIVAGLGASPLFSICEQDPKRWYWATPRGGVAGFYAFDTLRSHHPGAEELDPVLASALRAGETQAMHTHEDGGGIVIRVAEDGPCGVFYARWTALPNVRLGVAAISLGIVITLATMAGLAGFLFLARPTFRRVQLVAEAAQAVGQDNGYQATSDTVGDEVTQVARALDQAHERIVDDRATLLSRQAALERHLSDVAHDLKTPLTSLFMGLEAALREPDSNLQADAVQAALSDVVYISSLTENHYLGRRFEEKFELPAEALGRVDLNDVIARAARRFRVVGRSHRVEVDAAYPDAPTWVLCNEGMAEQVVSNLLQNAVTYGRPGGQVTAVIEQVGERPDRFSLVISDDGPGVAADDLEKLTQRAFRGDAARQRAPTGTGLGLAIVASVCEAHGWELSVGQAEPTGLEIVISGDLMSET